MLFKNGEEQFVILRPIDGNALKAFPRILQEANCEPNDGSKP